MAGLGLLGRDITLTVGGLTVLGTVTKEFAVANTAVDVTDDQSSGNRELLAKGGVKSIDVSLSGAAKNYALLATMFQGTQTVAVSVSLGDGASTESTLTFNAFLAEYSISGESNERVEFSASLQSSGTITFTAGT